MLVCTAGNSLSSLSIAFSMEKSQFVLFLSGAARWREERAAGLLPAVLTCLFLWKLAGACVLS